LQIDFHPNNTFVTAGSDGSMHFWDKDSKSRLKTGANLRSPISTARFSPDGSLLAYALGYDWSKGRLGYKPEVHMPSLLIHVTQSSEVTPKLRP